MTGTCRFCGQTMMVDYDSFTEEMAEKIKNGMSVDDIATNECKCPEGMEYRNVEKCKEDAKANAESLFKIDFDVPFPDEKAKRKNIALLDLMNIIIDNIAAGTIKKVTLNIDKRVKATISDKPDKIEVNRAFKDSQSLAAEKY